MSKTKVIGTIVNTSRNLIGLTISGTEADFGGVGNAPAERNCHVGELSKQRFRNKQLSFTEKGIVEGPNFKLNTLPMKVLVNNGLVSIGNSIALIGRFEKDGKNIGYVVQYADGTKENITVEALASRVHWFKPTNFTVRSTGMGRGYIAGTNGLVIADLPVQVIGDKQTNRKKTGTNAIKTGSAVSTTNNTAGSGYDILDIFDLTSKLGGQIIKFSGDKYIPINTGRTADTEGFNDYHFGEVAEPRIAFNATKLNANGNFKKVGFVPVNINGTNKRITTFIYRTKSIFAYGENNLQTLGIAVGASKKNDVIGTLGASLSVEEKNDAYTVNCLNAIIDAGEPLSIFSVNVQNLELISAAKRQKSLLTAEQLEKLCYKKFCNKLISKYLSPRADLVKGLKNKIGDKAAAAATSKKLAAEFVGYNDELLQQFKDMGFDIYSGAYVRVDTSSTGTKKSDDEKVSIEYSLDGLDDTRITAKQLGIMIKDNDTSKVPADVIKLLSDIVAIGDSIEQYKAAIAAYRNAESNLAKISKLLWLHNASMYINGNKVHIHTHDAGNWEINNDTKVKTATVYRNTHIPKLLLKVNGVSI